MWYTLFWVDPKYTFLLQYALISKSMSITNPIYKNCNVDFRYNGVLTLDFFQKEQTKKTIANKNNADDTPALLFK